MTVTISGSSGVTYPAGGTANTAGAGVGTTDAQTLTNKTLTSPTITGATLSGTISGGTFTNSSITAANGNTVEATSGPTSTQLAGMRNKIINGAMMIDQRNAGAAVTTTGNFPVDRFYVNNATDATFSAQQSTDVPTGQGFVNSLKVTFPSGDASIGSTQYANIQHRIEGFNSADFAFGTAGAQSVTLSFWVKATVTGQYSYAIYNSAENRINPQSFTINASNTWEKKTITYAGDTSGTWLTNNGVGLNVTLYVALGSSYLGSSGWNSGGTYGVTGQANGLSSNGNIFAITGVQLEKGATATPFENRLYGTELALCQRYYEKSCPQTVAPADGQGAVSYSATAAYGNGAAWIPNINFAVTKRSTPSITTYSSNVTGTSGQWTFYNNGWFGVTMVAQGQNDSSFNLGSNGAIGSANIGYAVLGNWAATAEL